MFSDGIESIHSGLLLTDSGGKIFRRHFCIGERGIPKDCIYCITSSGMGETKIIYHIDDEDTPYLIKLPVPADRVTLGDFKNALNRPNFKFFFKSMDDDFG